jgi:hypothetical protein
MDRPEAVQVGLADGLTIVALCFDLPATSCPDEANPKFMRPRCVGPAKSYVLGMA